MAPAKPGDLLKGGASLLTKHRSRLRSAQLPSTRPSVVQAARAAMQAKAELAVSAALAGPEVLRATAVTEELAALVAPAELAALAEPAELRRVAASH